MGRVNDESLIGVRLSVGMHGDRAYTLPTGAITEIEAISSRWTAAVARGWPIAEKTTVRGAGPSVGVAIKSTVTMGAG